MLLDNERKIEERKIEKSTRIVIKFAGPLPVDDRIEQTLGNGLAV
jgi:hypothetical protein